MNEILTETKFIEDCESMSPEELLSYISECLEKQLIWDKTFEEIPNESQTYDVLIQLLQEKLNAEVKVINEEEKYSEKNRSKHIWRIKNEGQQREASVRSRISEICKSKELAFSQKDTIKDKIDNLIHFFLREFNQLNDCKLTIKQLAKKIKEADEFTGLKMFDKPKMRSGNQIYELGYWSNLVKLEEFIDSLPSRKIKPTKNKYYNKLDTEKLKFFVENFMLPPESQMIDGSEYTSMIIEYLFWKVLPAGERRLEIAIKHFKSLTQSDSKWKKKEHDESRLWQIEKFLKPNKCSIGTQGFEGYAVYSFNWTTKVILECPFYGNATYIVRDGWQEIAKLSKWEAKYEHSLQVTTINHTETWFKRLKAEIKRPS